MKIPRRGRWSSAAGRFFTWTRIYEDGWWTPWCEVRWRYPEYKLTGFFRPPAELKEEDGNGISDPV